MRNTLEIPRQFAFHDRVSKTAPSFSHFDNLVENGLSSLTREGKNNLFHMLQSNSGRHNYQLMGWSYPFKQFMKKFLVKYKYEGNTYREVWAFDKTCIRSSFYTNGGIVEIIELPAKKN